VEPTRWAAERAVLAAVRQKLVDDHHDRLDLVRLDVEFLAIEMNDGQIDLLEHLQHQVPQSDRSPVLGGKQRVHLRHRPDPRGDGLREHDGIARIGCTHLDERDER
jgi:hypothetical protein